MSRSVAVLHVVLVIFIGSCLSEVIYRDVNDKEGSVCFVNGGRFGVCRETCAVRLWTSGYGVNLCNPGRNPPLYCCVNEEETRRYPTLEGICFQRRIADEFEKRGRYEGEKLHKDLGQFKKTYVERVHSIRNWCDQNALTREENEREDFLEQCYTIPQFPLLTNIVRFESGRLDVPHAAGIGIRNLDGTTSWICSGSLIQELHVLTAASCILGAKKIVDTVRIGLYNLNEREFSTGFQYDIVRIFVHGSYIKGQFYNDIAVMQIKLSATSQRTDPWAMPLPACLWTKNDLPTTDLSLIGFLGASAEEQFRGVFFKGNVTLSPPRDCASDFRLSTLLPNGITQGQICARESPSDFSLCSGEVGGSLEYAENSWLKVPYIVGISSFGTSCDIREPSVFTRIYTYLDWIEMILSGRD